MERIKLAIEKARAGHVESHPSAIPLVRQAVAPADLPANEPVDTGASKAHPTQAVSVRYVQTQTVPLDAAHLDRHRVVSHQKTHPATWAFDVLRTQVLQKMDENGWRTIAITSPSVESGKTVVSVNLAMSIAKQTNRTALLVDFDLRRPSVSRTLGLNRSLSLNDVLAGRVDLGQALVNPGVERFVVLPTNQPVEEAAEVLSSGKVAGLIDDLRQRYSDRVVIFDLPPILVADDVMAVLPRIDCVLMVVGSGASTQTEIEEASDRLSKHNLLGVVLNRDETPTQNAYY